jgi:hypothetical protein
MFTFTQLLSDGLLASIVFTVVIGVVLWRKPRLFLHDFPADIQALTPPKTAQEKRLTKLVAVPVFALFLGLPLLFVLRLKADNGGVLAFGAAYAYVYGIFQIVNLWDLIVMDWIGMTVLVDPQKPPLPGTEGAAGWRDYGFHFRGFLKGTVMGAVLMLPVAALAVTAL